MKEETGLTRLMSGTIWNAGILTDRSETGKQAYAYTTVEKTKCQEKAK